MSSLPASRVPDPMTAPPLRWGILAPGWIAAAFAGGLRGGTQQILAAVGSRNPQRAAEFASRFDIPAHGTYEDVVNSDDVDVVYVASPHSEHHAQALLALAAGKPVLVEKAFTRNAGEAQEVIEAARARNLFCMEAMWARFLPHYDIVRQLVEDGALGEIETIEADHGQLLWPDGPQRLSDPALAGGALLDLGIYPISFAAMVLGDLGVPRAIGTRTPEGVDRQVSIVVSNAAGAQAYLNTTMAAQTPTRACVSGTKARVEIDGPFYAPASGRVIATDGQVIGSWDRPGESHEALRFEACEVARRITAGETSSPLMPPEETLAIMQFMDAVRDQIGVRFPGE